MSTTPTAPLTGTVPQPAPDPLSAQNISSIERSLLSDPFSPLTRSRQERLLAASFISVLIFLGFLKTDKSTVSIFGASFPFGGDLSDLKLFAAFLVAYLLLAFLVGVGQDYLMRQAFKLDIQGRFDGVAAAFNALKQNSETRYQAVGSELWHMLDDPKKLGGGAALSDAQRQEQIDALGNRARELVKQHFAESSENEMEFGALEKLFIHLKSNLDSYDKLRNLLMTFDALVPTAFGVGALVIWYLHRA
jgi:hypothetical protein